MTRNAVNGRDAFPTDAVRARQKASWPIHKIICRASVVNLSEIEVESLRRPLTTGLITSRLKALRTDIQNEYDKIHFREK